MNNNLKITNSSRIRWKKNDKKKLVSEDWFSGDVGGLDKERSKPGAGRLSKKETKMEKSR